ncbi:MAG: hypothetical protein R2790_10870 [Flavobacterium haoranii]
MKKNTFLNFTSAFLITFGITAIDLDNLKLNDNLKAYLSIVAGLAILIFILIKNKK